MVRDLAALTWPVSGQLASTIALSTAEAKSLGRLTGRETDLASHCVAEQHAVRSPIKSRPSGLDVYQGRLLTTVPELVALVLLC
jgi:hypothetical protein